MFEGTIDELTKSNVRTDFIVDLQDVPAFIAIDKKDPEKEIRKFIPKPKAKLPPREWKIVKPEIKFGGKGLTFLVPTYFSLPPTGERF